MQQYERLHWDHLRSDGRQQTLPRGRHPAAQPGPHRAGRVEQQRAVRGDGRPRGHRGQQHDRRLYRERPGRNAGDDVLQVPPAAGGVAEPGGLCEAEDASGRPGRRLQLQRSLLKIA
uniref:(northern house mosquito) hypothetical protein n=1 Tax=Culex pipiens TaxID=7175 RepID=A0A8D8D8L1_CULPI